MRQPYEDAFEGYDYVLEEWIDPLHDETSRSSNERRGTVSNNSSVSGFEGWTIPLCPHRPQHVLKGQNGWSVWAGAEGDCIKSMDAFQLLLNLTGTSVLSRHVVPVPELHRWEEPAAVPEIVLDWPDMGVVTFPRLFWEELVAHLTKTQGKMLVFCVGGHGRTGTALACLMAVCGWTSEDAIAWIRANYCRRAIETREQERYILEIERNSPITGNLKESYSACNTGSR